VGDPNLPQQAEMRKVTDIVYLYLTPRGGPNAGLILTNSGAIVVDTLVTPAMARAFLAELRKITQAPIKYAIITHYHSDHFFGNQVFSPPTEIIAHQWTRDYYIHNAKKEFQFRKELMPNVDLSVVKIALPTLTLTEGTLRLFLGGREVRIHHWGPGQTHSDLFIYIPDEKVLFTGDSFNRKSINFMGSLGSMKGWLRTLEEIARMDVQVYLGGHGLPATKEDIAAYRGMLLAFRDEVGRGRAQGKSLEELTRALRFVQYRDWRNFERFVHPNIKAMYEAWGDPQRAADLQ
jgi:glyoxylase-like metal-dependent hydrolase (beta-lactamase superfamily II)